MLSLTDPQWSELRDAYGAASDVPKLLEQLAENPRPKKDAREEPWFMLWSKLCHQGDIYTASYAAVPHIIQIALNVDGPIDFDFFLLPTCIEIARATGRGPEIPEYLSVDYRTSIQKLPDCVAKHQSDPTDESMARSMKAALLIASGNIQEAQKVIEQDL